tara:strand:- start:283 stop:993 length:711 start_codon:yes stop_codon:yes gene_type:complete
MSLLPKLNNMPKYLVDVPSMKKDINIRPFLVKEEKIMLIAMESQDGKQIAQAVLDTVKSCILDEINVNSLTSYDVEYLFLKIRSKSVGETAKLLFKCESCNDENEVIVKLDDIKIDVKNADNVIKINDTISVEMKHPSFISLANSEDVITESPTRQIFGLIKESIISVMTEDERIDMREVKFEEFEEFMESMTGDQFTKIREYIQDIPKLKHDIEYKCKACEHENKISVEGLQSFL